MKEYNERFGLSKSEFSSFVEFAFNKGVSGDPTDIAASEEILKTRIKAYVARHIWGERGFYIVIHKIDHSFQKAMEELTLADDI